MSTAAAIAFTVQMSVIFGIPAAMLVRNIAKRNSRRRPQAQSTVPKSSVLRTLRPPMQHPRLQHRARLLPGGVGVRAVLRDAQQTPATREARPLRRVLHLPRARKRISTTFYNSPRRAAPPHRNCALTLSSSRAALNDGVNSRAQNSASASSASQSRSSSTASR